MRMLLATLSLAAAGLTACGGSGAPTHDAVSPATARKQVAATRSALAAALASYRRGQRVRAADQVAEAYVSHFEDVEGPLEGRNAALKEQLEDAIAKDLRADIKAGRPAAAVAARVRAIQALLDRADTTLR